MIEVNAVYYLDAALTHASLEEWELCIGDLQESIRIEPNNPIALELLAECLKILEKKKNYRRSSVSTPPVTS